MRKPNRRVTNPINAMTPEIVPPITAPVLMEEEGVGVSKKEVGSEEERVAVSTEEVGSEEERVAVSTEGVTSEGDTDGTSAMKGKVA